MYAKNKNINAPSDMHAKDKLNLYVYEYLYHIGAAKAAQGFCADMKWEPNKMSLGETPGFLLSWWCVFWDLYSAAPERREQHPHSEEAKAFHDYGFINSNGLPPQPNPNGPPPMSMNVNEPMHNPGAAFFPQPGQHMMHQYPRYANPPPRPLVRMPSQSDYPVGGPGMLPQMDTGRNGMRMTSPGARIPPNPMGHMGPGGPAPPHSYRPQVMSPSINQTGQRMYVSHSPGVGYSASSPAPYGVSCPPGHTPTTPTMMSSPHDSNSGEMQQYAMRSLPMGMGPGPNPMYHDPHLGHMPAEMTAHGPMNGEYDQPMKQSPNHPVAGSGAADLNTFNYFEDPSNDTNAILKIKETMQEEVKKFTKTPNNSNNDDFNHFGSIG